MLSITCKCTGSIRTAENQLSNSGKLAVFGCGSTENSYFQHGSCSENSVQVTVSTTKMYALQYRTGPEQGFSQGKTCFHYREPLFSLQGPLFLLQGMGLQCGDCGKRGPHVSLFFFFEQKLEKLCLCKNLMFLNIFLTDIKNKNSSLFLTKIGTYDHCGSLRARKAVAPFQLLNGCTSKA